MAADIDCPYSESMSISGSWVSLQVALTVDYIRALYELSEEIGGGALLGDNC